MDFPDSALYFETLRDLYEAFVIFSFLQLILAYCGGEGSCIQPIEMLPPLRHTCPFCCLPAMRRDIFLVRRCKQGALQFVILKPLLGISSLLGLWLGYYDSDGYQWVLVTSYNLSYAIALYALLMFVLACGTVAADFNPVRKFVAVKAVIVTAWYQRFAIQACTHTPKQVSERAAAHWCAFLHCLVWCGQVSEWQDLVLSVEIVLFALLLGRAFSAADFRPVDHGVHAAPAPRCVRLRALLANAADVLSVRDVILDALHSFKTDYSDYALQVGGGRDCKRARYRERERQRDRETERQRDKRDRRDREKERKRDKRDTERETGAP
jgi:hypothetical protein